MPLYEYECSKCSHVFETYQKIGEGGENLTCPQCDAPNPQKLISPFSSLGWSRFLDDMSDRASKPPDPSRYKNFKLP